MRNLTWKRSMVSLPKYLGVWGSVAELSQSKKEREKSQVNVGNQKALDSNDYKSFMR
jgi:hypothetical protein